MNNNKQNIVIKFNEAINNRDAETLSTLMTDDHVFVDSAGQSFKGREKAIETWQGFFEAFPDYKNHFNILIEEDDLVVITGRSSCSNEPMLDGPALWTAKVQDGKVSEWRVYDDTQKNRKHLRV